MKQTVTFNVKNLRITKTSNIYAVEGVKNVFDALFDFQTADWNGLVKTAVFENTEGTKEKRLLVEDRCEIPDSFFITSGVCFVSVFAGDYMCTNKVAIVVANAGYKPSEGDPDAKNYYEQILRYFDATNKELKENADTAKRYAVGLEENPETMKDNAKYYAKEAKDCVMGIPGQVNDAKKDIDKYVDEKEEELRGKDGNVCFVAFQIVPPMLFMKNNPSETQIDFRLNGSRLEYKWKDVAN